YLHDCSDCFRLERIAGWALHPLESAASSRRTPIADLSLRGQAALHAPLRPSADHSHSRHGDRQRTFSWLRATVCWLCKPALASPIVSSESRPFRSIAT